MRAASLIDVTYLACTFILIWWAVIRLWPEIVRARLRVEVVKARDQLVDAVLAGHIDRNDPALRGTLRFCMQLIDHPELVSIGRATAAHYALEREGLDQEVLLERPTLARMQPPGRRVMNEVETTLTEVLKQYLIQGSRWWWLLVPYWAGHKRRCQDVNCCKRGVKSRSGRIEPGHLAADFLAQCKYEKEDPPPRRSVF